MSRTLIVCYSQTGCTASLVQEIVGMTGWERADIRDKYPRIGVLSTVRSMLDALLHTRPRISGDISPQGYDMVVLAAPVWMRGIAAPMRTYIARHRGEFKSLAYICTYGGNGAERAALQASKLAGVRLVAALGITSFEMEQADYRRRLDSFLASVSMRASK